MVGRYVQVVRVGQTLWRSIPCDFGGSCMGHTTEVTVSCCSWAAFGSGIDKTSCMWRRMVSALPQS
jgi:hypothetical protein